MPLPGWIPPAFRRDVAEKKAKAAAIAAQAGPQRAIPARAGFVPGIPAGGIDEHIQAIGSSTGSDRKTLLEELYDCYVAVQPAWTAVQVIARTITAGGLYTDWDTDAGEGDEAPDKPPSVVALERFYAFCNPDQDIRQILRNAITALQVFGDALLELVWDGPTPVALYNLDVPTTYPRADEHGRITGWVQQTDTGQTAEFEPREVIHISLDSARPGVSGVPPLQAVLQSMAAWLYAAATEKEMLRKGLPVNVHVDLPAGEDETRWDNRYRARNLGTKNIGAPLISKGGGKVTELQAGKLADVLQAKKDARDEILAGCGVPPAEGGVIESGNLGGGTGDAQHRSLVLNTCNPVAELLLEKLNFHIAVQGFGVQGWRSKFREVDYRDSMVVEQIRDTRLRNGSWIQNRYRADIGEPPIEGGDKAVLVDRQNLVLWEDLEALSKATVAGKDPATAAMTGMPPQGPPAPFGQQARQSGKPGTESLAGQRAQVREALRRYHAASAALYEDASSGVYAQMSRAFPAAAISWVKNAAWQGPQQVPLDQVDMSDKDQWRASAEPGKVARIARKMRRGKKPPRPAILVRWPGSQKDVIVDGHHHILAAEQDGQHFIWAYVGHVDSGRGPWMQTASRELRKKAA
jgi:Phage portal protein